MAQDQQRFGKYRLLRRIAAGGMGEVHLAKLVGPAGFEKLVVIKRLLEQRRSEAKYLEMFFSEARVAAQLNHSNIVQIYETGEVDDVPYIAMEYVHGKSLRKILDTAKTTAGGRLPAAFAGYIVAQLCRGLSFAHNAHHLSGAVMDLIHRDINPLNVLVSYQGEVKIIDFGIAKSELTLDQTQAGTIKGTVVYMSPEQSLGHRLDRRSDLFSVGICLYEALSGTNPFHQGSLGASLDAIRRAAAPPIDAADPALQPFAELLSRVLTVRPEQRYADCHELADGLESLLASGRIARPVVSLTGYMQQLFGADIKQEEQSLERTDFANLDDLANAAPSRAPGTAVLSARPGERLDGERTFGKGRPMLQTSSVFAGSREAATGEQLAATSERGTPQPSVQFHSLVATAPQPMQAGGARRTTQPVSASPPAPPLRAAAPQHHDGEDTPIVDTHRRQGRETRLDAWLGRATDALAERAPGLRGLWQWLALAPGKPGGRFGLPVLLVFGVASLATWLALSVQHHEEPAPAAPPPKALAAAPSFLEGEVDAAHPAGLAVSKDEARVLQLIEEKGRPATGGRLGETPSGTGGQKEADRPVARKRPAAAPLGANRGGHRHSAAQHQPSAGRAAPSDAYSLRPQVAPQHMGPAFRLRADPPLSVHHNGQVTQNPVHLHPGSGLLEFRSGPTNGTFNVRVNYRAVGQEVDFTLDAEPWADVYGAGGIKLGRTPVRLNHLGEATPLVLKNPHVRAAQHITLRLDGVARPAEQPAD